MCLFNLVPTFRIVCFLRPRSRDALLSFYRLLHQPAVVSAAGNSTGSGTSRQQVGQAHTGLPYENLFIY